MTAIGNFLWFILGGVLMGLGWWLVGALAFLTIVGAPWGRACFVIGKFAFFPFGQEAISRKELTQQGDIGTSPFGTVGNIIWFVFAGIWLAIGHVASAIALALTIIGIEPPYNDISFGAFTGNNTLIDWFNRLTMHFGLKGRARISWKLHGKNRTLGIDKEQALEELCKGLQNPNQAYIYHCYNHYMCPIGFEMTPMCPSDAYKTDIRRSELVPWIIIGEPSKTNSVFHTKKWDDIALDIDQQNPHFYNIRKSNLGVQTREGEVFKSGKKLGKNMHCLISFEKVE